MRQELESGQRLGRRAESVARHGVVAAFVVYRHPGGVGGKRIGA